MDDAFDFDVDSESIDLVVELTDFLMENKEQFVFDFTENAQAFLANRGLFIGPFRLAYNKAFNSFINSLLQEEIIEHFPKLDPEQVVVFTELLGVITDDYFYNQDLYFDSNTIPSNS